MSHGLLQPVILPIQHEIAKLSRSKSLVQQKLEGENLSHYDHRDSICLFLLDYYLYLYESVVTYSGCIDRGFDYRFVLLAEAHG